MSGSPSNQKSCPIDLDTLVSEFNSWQQFIFQTGQEKAECQEKIQMFNQLLGEAADREAGVKKECEELHDSINKLQGCILKRCNLEDENLALKEQMRHMEEEKQELKKQHQESLSRLGQEQEDLQSQHQEDLEGLEAAIKAQANLEKASLQTVLDEERETVKKLGRSLEDTEHRAQAEVMRVRQEFEAKLLKLEKQASKKQQTSSSTSLNQDIFRKKLQFVKAESEREITSLKQTIADLQQRLSAHLHSQGPSTAPQPSKRTRRF